MNFFRFYNWISIYSLCKNKELLELSIYLKEFGNGRLYNVITIIVGSILNWNNGPSDPEGKDWISMKRFNIFIYILKLS